MGAIDAAQNALDEESRQLWLFTEVDEDMARLAIPTLQLWGGDSDPVVVHIMSEGGCPTAGVAIYDAIRATSCQVATLAHGDVMSSAALIYLAGDRRVMRPHARLMFHRSFNSVNDGAQLDHDRAKAQRDYCDQLLKGIWRDLDVPFQRYCNVVFDQSKELWLTATEARLDCVAHAVSDD